MILNFVLTKCTRQVIYQEELIMAWIFIMSHRRLTLFFFTDLDQSLRTCYSHKNGGVLPLSENRKQPFQQKLKVLHNLADQF